MQRLFLALFILLLMWTSCGSITGGNKADINYREEMRTFVKEISTFARNEHPGFVVIPQNGHELVIRNEEPASGYLSAIDGLGQESLFYGYKADNEATPASETNWLINLLEVGKEAGKTILVTDYCSTTFKMNSSYSSNDSYGYVAFAAPSRELDVIPDHPSPLHQENQNDILDLSDAQNFLYLLNPHLFKNKKDFLSSIASTNYDAVIIDAFYHESILTPADMLQIRNKANGGKRLIIAYMSIGEAEDYRFYWNNDWWNNPPDWLARENPNWAGNFKVRYWQDEWKQVITGNDSSYTQLIIDAGFDGVYLDIIDAFEYFEK